LSDLYEVKYFTDEFDRLADEADPDLWAYRRERHLAAVLHIQVQQFFMGLEAALAPRITNPLSGGRLLQLGLSVAEELKLEPDEGDPDLFDQFAYMHALADAIPFDATYGAGFAPDGSISILVGPDLPPFAEIGICGSREHDGRDLQTDRDCLFLHEVCCETGRPAQVRLSRGTVSNHRHHPWGSALLQRLATSA